jgi:hypothetical protein
MNVGILFLPPRLASGWQGSGNYAKIPTYSNQIL